ncbi:hypothetical protein DRQ25_01670 [Candidatus Fermentibacteria bacterium]|nr:MAG: hypothetical protein DRQ25_01670 [Candidatus Fermentibacteria bacterium]
MEMLDEGLQKLIATVDLEGTTCGLKHSAEDPSEDHPAVDYLCQNLGYDLDGNIMIDAIIQIPVCEECANALYGAEWVLCYCTECMSSQWILKSKSKVRFDNDVHVIWMKECPVCYSENVQQLDEQ